MTKKSDSIENDGLGDLNAGEKGEGKTPLVEETKGKKPTQESSTDELVKKLISRLDKLEEENKSLRTEKDATSTANMIAQIVNQLKAGESGGEHNPYKYFTPEELDPADVLKEPVIFYAYSTGYVISDDLRNGKPVKTPNGNTILFLYQATQKIKDGSGTNLQSYCTYPSYSQKEVKWLKEHRFFGIHFFETLKEAIETNSEIASKITKHLTSLTALQPQQIMNIYRQKFPEGTLKDVDKMKNKLAMEAVKMEILSDAEAQNSFFSDVFKKHYETKNDKSVFAH